MMSKPTSHKITATPSTVICNISKVETSAPRSEEHTSELQSLANLVCRLLLEKKKPNHETNINIIARHTGKDINSHTFLHGRITTIMSTIQRLNIIGRRKCTRNRRRLTANQTGNKFRVGIKSNISTNRNNLISGDDRCIHLNARKKTTITRIIRFSINVSRTSGIYTLSLHDALPI